MEQGGSPSKGPKERPSRKKAKPQDFLDSDPNWLVKKKVNYISGFGVVVSQCFNPGDFIVNYRGKNLVSDAPIDPYVF